MNSTRLQGPIVSVGILTLSIFGLLALGCIGNKQYNLTPDQYLHQIVEPSDESVSLDLAIIEFDEFGMLWDMAQLEDALSLIAERNATSERGVLLVTFTHGWMNNANPEDEDGNLAKFETDMRALAADLHRQGAPAPDHVFGVYLGWRGATNRIPGLSTTTFWDRQRTAERVSSYQMRETLFRLTSAIKARSDSKVFISGHSMGGMIVGRTLGPALATLMLAADEQGVRIPADLVLMQNPALDGLSVYQLVEYLKRNGAIAELRHNDGQVETAPGPIIVSITSEADNVTKVAYAAGRVVEFLSASFRSSLGMDVPGQGKLATRAHGHLPYLISHRAWMEDGALKVERVPGAYNDTPFWIVQTSAEISNAHGDIHNPRFLLLLEYLTELNDFYDADVQTWIRTTGAGNVGAED